MRFTKVSLGIVAAAAVLALALPTHAQTNSSPRGPGARQGQGGGARGSVDDQMARLSEQLKLTDAQKPKVKAALEEQRRKMQELRGDTTAPQEDRRAKVQVIREDHNKKMKEILTADQIKQYEELQSQQRGRRAGQGGGQGGNRNRNAGGNAQQ